MANNAKSPRGLRWFDSLVDTQVSALTKGSRLEHKSRDKNENFLGWRIIFNPIANYWAVVASVIVLTALGLIMVFSSSTAKLAGTNQPLWSSLVRQGAFAVVGCIVAILIQVVRPTVVRRLSTFVLIVALILQALTLTSIGDSAGGNAGWIILGPIRLQPAEILKFALCIWLPNALIAAKKQADKQHASRLNIIPYLSPGIVFVLALGLVFLGKDVGTAIIVAFIGIAAFFLAGFPISYLVGIGLSAGLILFLVLIRGSSNRWSRIQATYGGCSTREAAQSKAICFQSLHGDYALATGGLTGVGLGNSREKSYLPAQDNDYIFAIIGEELGFIGALVVILFIVVMAWSLINISLRHQSIYMQVTLLCFAVWFATQSFINIAVVLGLLPVMGLPLPFISSGGSALIMCLAGAGICIRMAREQEDVRATRVHE